MNNINIVEKKDNENDKHISKFFLRNKIYLDNIKGENSLYYEEFLSTFLKENNYKLNLELFTNDLLITEEKIIINYTLNDEVIKFTLIKEVLW